MKPSQHPKRSVALILALLLAMVCALLCTNDCKAANTHAAKLVGNASQYFSAPSSASLSVTGDFTFEAWVKITTPPSSGQQYSIINKDDNGGNRSFSIWYVNNAGTLKLAVNIFGTGYSYPNNYLNITCNCDLGNVWHHIAIVCTIANSSSNKVTFYVDGVSLGNGSKEDGNRVTDIKNGTADLRIGRGHTSEYFDGYIDDVRLWGVARTGQQIQDNRFKELLGTESNLRAYWKFNASLADSTSNGNVLTNNNSATFGNVDLPFIEPDPPSITSHPVGRFISLGTNITLSVMANGFQPLSYQWRRNGANILAGTNYFGIDMPSLVISNLEAAQLGAYSVLVTNTLGTIISGSAIVGLVDTQDDDNDGIPNWWETAFGLRLDEPLDANTRPLGLGEQLTYLQKYLHGLDPTTLDTDGDGLSDFDELFIHGTDPLKPDSDGDAMPDGWEVQHGLNPRFNDAADDLDGDGLSNLAEYNYSLSHTNQVIDPRTKYSIGASTSDYAVVNGAGTNWFLYDRNNRLTGAEFDRGLALAYVYDGNDNLVRQVSMQHDANTNGLPDVWEFVNGLTNNARAYTDSDGDGWSDWQEWKSGTRPTNAASAPNLLGNPGINIASLTLPFTPSNFVVGVGQLDGLGAEEIILGADGNPGNTTNFLLVLTQGATTWSTQRVDVGPFGITSIAVGQPTNRPGGGIYVGLRGTTNGSGRVMEFTSNAGLWQSNLVALSTNQAAFVLGVRGQDVLVSLATTNAPDGSLSAVKFSTNWSLSLMDTNTSHRGLGTLFQPQQQTISAGALRLLDSGGIAVGTTQFSVLAANLVSYWKLDESSGNASDSVGSNTLINNNTVTYSAAKINNGADFGSANNNKFLSNDSSLGLDGNSSFTFSGWINITTAPTAGNEIDFSYLQKGASSALGFAYQLGYKNVAGALKLTAARCGLGT